MKLILKIVFTILLLTSIQQNQLHAQDSLDQKIKRLDEFYKKANMIQLYIYYLINIIANCI